MRNLTLVLLLTVGANTTANAEENLVKGTREWLGWKGGGDKFTLCDGTSHSTADAIVKPTNEKCGRGTPPPRSLAFEKARFVTFDVKTQQLTLDVGSVHFAMLREDPKGFSLNESGGGSMVTFFVPESALKAKGIELRTLSSLPAGTKITASVLEVGQAEKIELPMVERPDLNQ